MNYLEKVYVSDHSLKGCTYNQYFSYYFLSEIKTERGIIKFAVKEVDNITKEEDVYTYNYITKPEDPTLRNFNNFPRGIVYIRLRGSISKVNLVTAILFGGYLLIQSGEPGGYYVKTTKCLLTYVKPGHLFLRLSWRTNEAHRVWS